MTKVQSAGSALPVKPDHELPENSAPGRYDPTWLSAQLSGPGSADAAAHPKNSAGAAAELPELAAQAPEVEPVPEPRQLLQPPCPDDEWRAIQRSSGRSGLRGCSATASPHPGAADRFLRGRNGRQHHRHREVDVADNRTEAGGQAFSRSLEWSGNNSLRCAHAPARPCSVRAAERSPDPGSCSRSCAGPHDAQPAGRAANSAAGLARFCRCARDRRLAGGN